MSEGEGPGNSNGTKIAVIALLVLVVAPITLFGCITCGSVVGLNMLGRSLDAKFQEVNEAIEGVE